MRTLYGLLIFVPLALALDWAEAPEPWVFGAAALAIVPLSGVLGRATEELAAHAGPAVGGLLNATLGNAAELVIAVFALRAGLVDLVKASLTGSILGNLLLILGLSLLWGGLRHPRQRFNRRAAGMNAAMLILAVVGLVVPAAFAFTHPAASGATLTHLSEWVAVFLIAVYGLGLVFALKTHRNAVGGTGSEHEAPQWTLRRALLVLAGSAAFIGWMSEVLVGATEATLAGLKLSELFVGIIIVPLIGNAAEHATAVVSARKNQMDLALGIAIGSSTQIALLVAPLLVFASLILGHPMDFVFTAFEVTAVALAVGVVAILSLDGESNWLEGAQLLAVYGILAVAFFFY